MKVGIKLIDRSFPLPKYQTKGSAAFDLYSRQSIIIPAKTTKLVPLNIILHLPEDHWALMAARSSLYKKNLMLINGIGIGDYDYRGPNDEYHAALYNFSEKKVEIEKGERIVQMIILPRKKTEFIEIADLTDQNSRGGFGSTG